MDTIAKIVLGILLGVLVILLFFLGFAFYYEMTLDCGRGQVIKLPFIKKEFKAAYNTTQFMWIGNAMMPMVQYHSEQYLNYFTLNGETFIVNSKRLFEAVEPEAIISVRDCKRDNKHQFYRSP